MELDDPFAELEAMRAIQAAPGDLRPSPPRWQIILILFVGVTGGMATALDWLSGVESSLGLGRTLTAGALAGAAAAILLRAAMLHLFDRWISDDQAYARACTADAWTDLYLLLPFVGAFGVVLSPTTSAIAAIGLLLVKSITIAAVMEPADRRRFLASADWHAVILVLAGIGWAIGKVVFWRLIARSFRVDSMLPAILATAFAGGAAIGVGLGAWIARRKPGHVSNFFAALLVFGAFYCTIGLPTVGQAADWTRSAPPYAGLAMAGALVAVPAIVSGIAVLLGIVLVRQTVMQSGTAVLLTLGAVLAGAGSGYFIQADVLEPLADAQAMTVSASVIQLSAGVIWWWVWHRRQTGATESDELTSGSQPRLPSAR